ncbi:MAG: LemA family protein [Methylobacteriaceae bacterium]|nr:LemA family protein [Methylobacteriaceae bacterium]
MWMMAPLGTAAVAIGAGVLTYNRLQALDQRCDTAFADIDVQLKHRHNLIPQIVQTVKSFAGQEKGILDGVVAARGKALAARSQEEQLAAEWSLGRQLTQLMSVVESYPQLQSSAHFTELRREISDVENKIAAARRFLNLAVDEYNATLRQFPGNMLARAFGMSRRRGYDLGVERVLIDDPAPLAL